MTRALCAAAALVVCALSAAAAEHSLKVEKAAAPKELAAPTQKLLDEEVIRVSDDKEQLLAEFWFRKEIPAKATDAQIANGLTYQEIPQTTVLGVVKVHQEMGDYKKHTIKPGLYTMRLAYQPMDGDHMGTAPYAEFVILVPTQFDKGEETLAAETLHKLGKGASGSGHPAVWLLFPLYKNDLGKPPALQKKPDNHIVLYLTRPVTVSGKKASIGIGLTIVGFSPSA